MEQAVERIFRKMLNYRAKTVPKLARSRAIKGLIAAVPTLALYWLCAFFPEVIFLKAAFGVSRLIFFAYAISCAGVLFSGEVAGGAGKVIETGWRYYRKLPGIFTMPKNIIAVPGQQFTSHTRTNARARAHRGTRKPTFARSSKNSSDDGESDQGDPPGPSYPQHFVTFNFSTVKLNRFLSQRRVLHRHHYLCVSCRQGVSRRCAA